MRWIVLAVGSVLATVALFASVIKENNSLFELYAVLQIVVILLTRDQLRGNQWYYPLLLGWWGASLLGSGWLESYLGLKMSPVSVSFGPGFLIMAVLSLIWPQWFKPRPRNSVKES